MLIGRRMLRVDAWSGEGPLKDNLEAMEFVYIDGMPRMRCGEPRSIPRGSVCSLLVVKIYKDKLVSSLVPEGSPHWIIPNFNPLSGEP